MIPTLQRPFDDPEDISTHFWLKAPSNKSSFSHPKTFESQLAVKAKKSREGYKISTLKLVEDKLISFSVRSPQFRIGNIFHRFCRKKIKVKSNILI